MDYFFHWSDIDMNVHELNGHYYVEVADTDTYNRRFYPFYRETNERDLIEIFNCYILRNARYPDHARTTFEAFLATVFKKSYIASD